MAVFTVTNLLDSGAGSLRDAISQSNSRLGDDTIEFSPELSGTIDLITGELWLTDSVEINSPSADQIKIDAQQQSRIFNIDDAENLALEVTLDGLTLTGGRANGELAQGGAILNRGRHLRIKNSIIFENSAVGNLTSEGGAIANIGTFVKSDSLTSVIPGGLLITPANLTIVNSELSSNTSEIIDTFGTAEGGAIFSIFQGENQSTEPLTDSDRQTLLENQNRISILSSSISDNQTISSDTAGGGGISGYFSSIEIEDSTVARNTVLGDFTEGAGLASYGSQLSVRNSTLANNKLEGPSSRGGGIFSLDGELDINNSTITGNIAGNEFSFFGSSIGGGIAGAFDRPIAINSSIVAENRAASNPDIAWVGDADSIAGGFNLIGAIANEPFPLENGVNGNLIGTLDNPIDPQLGPLQNNGGVTETREVLSDSPAIDAGSNLLELNRDQRGSGFARSMDQTDIGAFELQKAIAPPAVVDQMLYGTAADDVLLGGRGNDRLYGNGGQDTLLGGAGNDQLYGAANSDETFDGGVGNDELWLNGGRDQIILSADSGIDTVHGFQLGQTQFVLSDGLTFADLSFAQNDGFSEIMLGADVLAQVKWVSAAQLATAGNFANAV